MTTQPTNMPVPSESPRDLKFNAGKIDEFVTSDSHDYVDRFGDKHRTIAGINYDANQAMLNYGYITKKSFEIGATLDTPNTVLQWESNSEFYRWDGDWSQPKVVPAGSTPDSSGGIGEGKWLGVGDASLRSDLNLNTGAGIVRSSSGLTVQQELDKIKEPLVLDLADFSDLKSAINALPGTGGIISVPIGRFYAGEWSGSSDYMSKPNVSIRGMKMPSYNSDASALVGGSIIEGRFNVFADNFSVSDVGFDLGLNVCNSRYPGADTTADHPDGGTWDAFAFGQPSQISPIPARRGFSAINFIGLLEQSSTVGHAILIEGVDGGFVDNVIGIYGVHGVVLKSRNMQCGAIAGYMASTDNVIFKSDNYAIGGAIQVDSVVSARDLPNCTPHSAPAIAEFGVYFNPETASFAGAIQISKLRIIGAKYSIIGANASDNVGDNIQLGDVYIDGESGSTEWGVFFANFGTFPRMSIGNINMTNVKNGAYFNYKDSAGAGNAQTTVGSLKLTYCDNIGILTAGSARVVISSVEMLGVPTAYYQDHTSILRIGTECLVGVTTKFGNSPYVIGPGWVNTAGNEILDVMYDGYDISLTGFLQASSGVTNVIMTVPGYLRPSLNVNFIALTYSSGSAGFCMVTVASDGVISINGAAPAPGTLLSLNGIRWKHKK